MVELSNSVQNSENVELSKLKSNAHSMSECLNTLLKRIEQLEVDLQSKNNPNPASNIRPDLFQTAEPVSLPTSLVNLLEFICRAKQFVSTQP
jgi:hypothetical protein